ncbi:4-hydroxythreonine-4-phosphate dehydrogenase [soil metagenome]
MDFIFMLTNQDRTVGNCLEVIDSISDLGLRHIGFKDIGVAQPVLAELTKRIAASGATSYVEVVSTTPESIRASITAAAKLGVDRVLGGQDVDFALQSFNQHGPAYYPFPGRPVGHPTQLGGSEDDIEADCRRVREAGCPGADLLAYRATEAEPRALIRAARRGLGDDGYLIVAGSIDTPGRIAEVRDAGADAFTIGSAIFENRFAAGVTGVRGQCEAVLRAIA